MKVAWNRLIRFVDTEGKIRRGEPVLPTPDYDLGKVTPEDGLKAKILIGADIYDESGETKVSDEIAIVHTVLGPLEPAEVPILRCVGLNYAKHSTWFSFCSHQSVQPSSWGLV
jgi:hypothetical protein